MEAMDPAQSPHAIEMRSGNEGLAYFTKCFVEPGSEMRSSLHRQPTVAPAGPKSRHALNPMCGFGCSVPRRVIGQFLSQMRWNVRNDQGVIAFVSQFKHVTNSMNLGDQGRFI